MAFDLNLDEETLAAIEREAERQEATVERLAAHAVLVYLADLDEAPPSLSWTSRKSRV